MTDQKQRRGVIPEYLKGNYQTEYERLDVEPLYQRPNKAVTTEEQKRMIQYHNPQSAAQVKTLPRQRQAPRRVPSQNKQQVPYQPKVQVGNHDDELWLDDQSFGSSPAMPTNNAKVIDNNEYVDTEFLQGADPLASTESHPYYEHPHTDAQTWEKSAQPQPQVKEEVIAVNPGNYVIFSSSGKVVCETPAEVRAHVEDLVLNRVVSINEIEVYKRLNLDFGVIMDE